MLRVAGGIRECAVRVSSSASVDDAGGGVGVGAGVGGGGKCCCQESCGQAISSFQLPTVHKQTSVSPATPTLAPGL